MINKFKINAELSVKNLLLHKLRTLLSVLGIAFGALSLIIVGNITKMMEKKVQLEAENFGKNLIIVRAAVIQASGRSSAFSLAKTLKERDGYFLKDMLPYVTTVAPAFDRSFPVRYMENRTQANVTGVTVDYTTLRKITIERGGFFTKNDFINAEKKAIIGYKVWQNLFGDSNPLGKYILLYRAPFEVVGVLAPMGVDLTGNDQDNQVLVPFSTMTRRILNVDYISTLYIQVSEETFLSKGKDDITKLLRKSHSLKEGIKNDFFVQTISDLASIKEESTKLVKELGNTASFLSFSIGGLGILAIMILTVSERKKEIGIRRACGAQRSDILTQFLFEAILLTFFGSLLGITLSTVITIIVSLVGKFPLAFSYYYILLSILLSLFLGLFSGIYPAKKASEVDPIKALQEVA
ncbi:MAG: ABC transporter permease [bacterium]